MALNCSCRRLDCCDKTLKEVVADLLLISRKEKEYGGGQAKAFSWAGSKSSIENAPRVRLFKVF